MSEISVIVPKVLIHPLFFSKDETMMLPKESLNQFDWERVFLYEVAYFCGIDSLKPWEMHEQVIPILLKESAVIQKELQTIFQQKNKKLALPMMKKAIALFLEMFHWANEVPVQLYPSIQYERLDIQPINVRERLEFILVRPNAYHSFVQLCELIVEMEKVYKKSLVIKNIQKNGD